MDLKGKTALVTGGGSGICLAFTERLLERGCNVLIADLRLTPDADALLSSSENRSAKAVFSEVDVTDWTQLQAVFDRALSEFGRLDIVCPGAGVFEPPSSSFWQYNTPDSVDTPTASSYRTLDINLTHPIRCTQLAIDYFLRQHPRTSEYVKRGHVVHLSSIAAQMVNPIVPLYLTSKAALSQFVRSMGGIDESLGIRVNAVAPGNTRTMLWATSNRHFVDPSKGDVWIEPGEIADFLIKLITEDRHVGGSIWEVGKNTVRRVELLNDPGPDRNEEGFGASDIKPAMAAYQESLNNFGK